jgi:hypothetical protein
MWPILPPPDKPEGPPEGPPPEGPPPEAKEFVPRCINKDWFKKMYS